MIARGKFIGQVQRNEALIYVCLESGVLFLKHVRRIKWLRDIKARKQSLENVHRIVKSIKLSIIETKLKKPQEFPPSLNSVGQIQCLLWAKKEQRMSAKSSWTEFSSKRKGSLEDSQALFLSLPHNNCVILVKSEKSLCSWLISGVYL